MKGCEIICKVRKVLLLKSRHLSSSNAIAQNVIESFKTLDIPLNSNQSVVRAAFLKLAKKYHPDSGSAEANGEKFVAIEKAFRILTKHNTGSSENEDVESIVFDIRHTAPQHRQYLSFEGIGHGTPFQREKQWTQYRAQRAASNVMEHRANKYLATENAIMDKGQQYSKKHDIKTKYGYDRLVEDLIQESMSKGEFDNLSGKGKPLKEQNTNPYVDFITHKLNEVLINNGFTPEWITMSKEIDQDVDLLKSDIKNARSFLGPWPLKLEETQKWEHVCQEHRHLAKTINSKINKYNLIVPLINKQKFLINFNEICEDILKNGEHSKAEPVTMSTVEQKNVVENDFVAVFMNFFSDIFTDKDKKKKVDS